MYWLACIFFFLLYLFYKLLFSNFTKNNLNEKVIITEFFKYKYEFNGLNKYYNLDYIETESSGSKIESEDKDTYDNDMPFLIIIGTFDSLNNFIITFKDFLQDGKANNNFISVFLNQKLA